MKSLCLTCSPREVQLRFMSQLCTTYSKWKRFMQSTKWSAPFLCKEHHSIRKSWKLYNLLFFQIVYLLFTFSWQVNVAFPSKERQPKVTISSCNLSFLCQTQTFMQILFHPKTKDLSLLTMWHIIVRILHGRRVLKQLLFIVIINYYYYSRTSIIRHHWETVVMSDQQIVGLFM